MSGILKMELALDSAMTNGMIAIDEGNYEKTIHLLNYVKLELENYDVVMVNYALLIAYMQLGDMENAKKIVLEMDNININNKDITTTINTIKKELKNAKNIKLVTKNNSKQVDLDYFIKNYSIALSIHKIKDLAKKNNDPIWNLYLLALSGDNSSQNEFIEYYESSIKEVEEFDNLIDLYTNQDVVLPNINILQIFSICKYDMLFWLLITPEKINVLLNLEDFPIWAKQFLLERNSYLISVGIYSDNKVVIEDKSLELIESNFTWYDNLILKDLILSTLTTQNVDIIFNELNIIYDAYLIINDYNESSDEKILMAIVGYIYINIFDLNKLEKNIFNLTNVSLDNKIKDEVLASSELIKDLFF